MAGSEGSTVMKYRIALWAVIGCLIAAAWAFYFGSTDKANAIDPIVYTLASLTQPIVFFVRHSAFSLYDVIVANALTYAVVGLTVEMIRRKMNHAT
jgi:hypothetical protein